MKSSIGLDTFSDSSPWVVVKDSEQSVQNWKELHGGRSYPRFPRDDIFNEVGPALLVGRQYSNGQEMQQPREISAFHSAFPDPQAFEIDQADANLLRTAWQNISLFPDQQKPVLSRMKISEIENWNLRLDPYPRLSNLHFDFLFAFLICLFAAVYGGLHSLAWDAQYLSEDDLSMWHLCSFAVAVGLPILILISEIAMHLPSQAKFFFIVLYFSTMAYGAARYGLIVLSLLHLASSPPEVCHVPPWSAYFPHIS